MFVGSLHEYVRTYVCFVGEYDMLRLSKTDQVAKASVEVDRSRPN